MNLLRLSRERLLMLAAGACIALFALDHLVLTPCLEAWDSRAAEIHKLRTEITQGSATVEQEVRWLRWREEMGARRLPADPSSAENILLTRMDTLAKQSGLTLTALRPQWKESADRTSQPEIQVTGSGNISVVVKFLHGVESTPLALAVEHLELVPAMKNEGTLVLDLHLSGLCQAGAATPRRTTP